MAKRGVIDHPKFARLKRCLGVNRAIALGYLECVWQFAGRFTPQGNIGKYADADIEAWIEWDGEPGGLIAALVECGWIDADATHRLIIHDWCDHVDHTTAQALRRAGLEALGKRRPEETTTASVSTPQTKTGSKVSLDSTVLALCAHGVSTVCAPPEPEPEPMPENNPPLIPPTPSRNRAPDGMEQVMLRYGEITGRTRFGRESPEWRNLRARLKSGVPPGDCVLVIEHKVSQWRGTSMESHLVPSTLFRASHWDRYLDDAQVWESGGRQRAAETRPTAAPRDMTAAEAKVG